MNETDVSRELERLSGKVDELARSQHDAKELERLSDEVARLETALEAANERADDAEAAAANAEFELAHTNDVEPILEAIEDHRRELIDTAELYDRTIGL